MTLFRHPLFRAFFWANFTALALIGGSFAIMGLAFGTTVVILSVMEFTFSFDNAGVNAKILKRMSPFWQTMFLTVGILVAVFFMRMAFPILLVMATTGISASEAFNLALHNPTLYAEEMEAAHPEIVGFAGIFLAMIFIDWVSADKEHTWFGPAERMLEKLPSDGLASKAANSAVAFAIVLCVAYLFVDDWQKMAVAGLLGLAAYQAVNFLDSITEEKADKESVEEIAKKSGGHVKLATGAAGFVLFLKIELIDASFSFDGVSGAFAVTSNFLAIMVGLGVGALYIRSLTVYLVKNDTLGQYIYLEHGAYWSIGSLAVLMFASVAYEIPEVITGLLGVAIIGASFFHSVSYRKAHPEEFESAAEALDAELRLDDELLKLEAEAELAPRAELA